jgi:hypothetical protein
MCSVLINRKNRSLVANLAADSQFDDSELTDEMLAAYDFFYTGLVHWCLLGDHTQIPYSSLTELSHWLTDLSASLFHIQAIEA